jgi:hypothetical protein
MQVSSSHSVASVPDKVTSPESRCIDVFANCCKVISDDAATTDKQEQSKTQDPPRQACPLLKLSTELRLEICRYAIQHDLEIIKLIPQSYYRRRGPPPIRGALALLHTCRTLRVESIDAMEPLADALESSLEARKEDVESTLIASENSPSPVGMRAVLDRCALQATCCRELSMLESSLFEIDEVCSLLEFARETEENKTNG